MERRRFTVEVDIGRPQSATLTKVYEIVTDATIRATDRARQKARAQIRDDEDLSGGEVTEVRVTSVRDADAEGLGR